MSKYKVGDRIDTYAGPGMVVEVNQYHVLIRLDNGSFIPLVNTICEGCGQ